MPPKSLAELGRRQALQAVSHQWNQGLDGDLLLCRRACLIVSIRSTYWVACSGISSKFNAPAAPFAYDSSGVLPRMSIAHAVGHLQQATGHIIAVVHRDACLADHVVGRAVGAYLRQRPAADLTLNHAY